MSNECNIFSILNDMSHPQIVKYITEQLTDAGEVIAKKCLAIIHCIAMVKWLE